MYIAAYDQALAGFPTATGQHKPFPVVLVHSEIVKFRLCALKGMGRCLVNAWILIPHGKKPGMVVQASQHREGKDRRIPGPVAQQVQLDQ